MTLENNLLVYLLLSNSNKNIDITFVLTYFLIFYKGDSLEYHQELPFTTMDKDNDLSYTNCAEIYAGAWWYNTCHYSNLNGRYLAEDTDEFAKGIVWYEFGGFYNSLRRSEMKIRSKI